MAIADVHDERFEIGRVASRTFEVVGKNFLPFFLLGLIATLPNTLLVVAQNAAVVGQLGQGVDAGATVAAIGGAAIVGLFFSVILQAALTYGAIRHLNGQPVNFGAALRVAVGQFFPLLGMSILGGLGIALGMVLLIVPGVILYLMWVVIVPVRIAEQTPVFEAFGRSSDLTAGHRWAILGTVFVFFLGAGIAQAAVRPMLMTSTTTGLTWAYAGLNAVIAAIIAMVSATLIASIYYELRVIKEGIGPEQIAAVFE